LGWRRRFQEPAPTVLTVPWQIEIRDTAANITAYLNTFLNSFPTTGTGPVERAAFNSMRALFTLESANSQGNTFKLTTTGMWDGASMRITFNADPVGIGPTGEVLALY
jgi:hypothetical protein